MSKKNKNSPKNKNSKNNNNLKNSNNSKNNNNSKDSKISKNNSNSKDSKNSKNKNNSKNIKNTNNTDNKGTHQNASSLGRVKNDAEPATTKKDNTLTPHSDSQQTEPVQTSQKQKRVTTPEATPEAPLGHDEKGRPIDAPLGCDEKGRPIEAPLGYDEKGRPIEAPTPESTFRDKSLELNSMSRKERRAEKKRIYNEYTSEMSTLEKLKYFFDYYKWYILVPIFLIIIVVYLGTTIYKNSRPVALSYAILNCENADTVNTDFMYDYAEHFGLTGDYRFNTSLNLKVTYDYFKEHEEYITTSNSTDYNILSTQCQLNDYDVIIGNAAGIKYCTTADVVSRLKGFLDVNAYETLKPYMVEFENSYGGSDYFAIDVSNTQFAKDLNTGYDDVYISFPSAEPRNKKNALRLLEYILDVDLIDEE